MRKIFSVLGLMLLLLGLGEGCLFAGIPKRTGQTTSYHTGDDGWYRAGVAWSFQTADPAGNGDVVTIDNVTGLMWASDFNQAGCNNGNTLDWYDALDWAADLQFAGYSDWRLPNVTELFSLSPLSLQSNKGTATVEKYFPNTGPQNFMSSTTSPLFGGEDNAIYIQNYWLVGTWSKNFAINIRAVRGGH